MDATVFNEGGGAWHVNASPTMRSLCELIQAADKTITIIPDEEASALVGIKLGPYETVEQAMAAIGTHLGGRCTHARRRGRL